MGEHNLKDRSFSTNCITEGQIHKRTNSRKANLRSGSTMAVSVLFPSDVKGRVQLGEDSVSEPQQICGEFCPDVVDIVVGF